MRSLSRLRQYCSTMSKNPDLSLKETIRRWVSSWRLPKLSVQQFRKALVARTVLHQEQLHRQQAEQKLAMQLQTNLLLQQVTAALCAQMESQPALEAAVAQIGQSFRVSRASIYIYVPPPIPEVLLLAEYVEAGCTSMRQISFASGDSRFLPEVLAHDRAVASGWRSRQRSRWRSQSVLLAVRTAYRNQVNGVIVLQQCDHQRDWTAR